MDDLNASIQRFVRLSLVPSPPRWQDSGTNFVVFGRGNPRMMERIKNGIASAINSVGHISCFFVKGVTGAIPSCFDETNMSQYNIPILPPSSMFLTKTKKETNDEENYRSCPANSSGLHL